VGALSVPAAVLPRVVGVLVLGVWVAIWPNAVAEAQGPAVCDTVSAGRFGDLGNFDYGVFDGRAANQVFLAQDTLITAITVWRHPQDYVNGTPMRLYITEVELLGGLLRPDPSRILLAGEQILAGGPSDVPIPIRYEFDPPFSLPRRGHFSFAIKVETRSCAGDFGLRADSLGGYAEGDLWRTKADPFDCSFGDSPLWQDGRDLVFKIEFCLQPVAVLPDTWGRLKSRYYP
jgi:hypothetical protein